MSTATPGRGPLPYGYMKALVERTFRKHIGIELSQRDVWREIGTDERNRLVVAYETEEYAKERFYNAINSAISGSKPIVGLRRVSTAANGNSRFVYSPPKGSQSVGPELDTVTFERVGHTADGTVLYRDPDGVIGMVEFSPL